jgi:diguanylate cyclase (GGDEF)-like protein
VPLESLAAGEQLGRKSMFRVRAQVWKIYFIVGSIALALYMLRLPGRLEAALVFLFGLSASTAVFWGAWRYRPRPMLAWICLGIGQACATIGDLIFTQVAYLQLNIVDIDIQLWFYIVALLCFLTFIALLTWMFHRLVTRDALINGIVVTVALGIITWLFHIMPVLSAPMSLMQWADRVALPLMLLAIIAPLAVLLMTSLGNHWSMRFLFLAVCFYIVGTAFYNEIAGRAEQGFAALGALVYLNDAFFSITYLFIGMALLHPSIANFRSPVFSRTNAVTHFERLVLSACILVIPITFITLHVTGRAVDDLFTIVSMGIISLLVLWRYNRMANVLEAQNRQLKRQKDRLSYQAHTDALTTLPNRFFLSQYLSEVVERTCRSGQQGAVLMIDLNRFKEMNDTFGHDAGDRTLREIADQFVRQKRKSDVVARWGGDEFIYILEDVESEDNVLTFARRLHNEVSYQVEMQGRAVTISLSIGICLFPMGGSDVQTIVKNSDIALYQAKKSNGEKISMYNQ